VFSLLANKYLFSIKFRHDFKLHNKILHAFTSCMQRQNSMTINAGIITFFGILTGWMAWARFPSMQDSSLLHSVQTAFEAHPASYPMGTGGFFSGGKAAGA
jgi:metal-dependent HD superfamily phosphatase/phosphodiesterase